MLFCKDDRLHHPGEARLTQGSWLVTSFVTILPIYMWFINKDIIIKFRLCTSMSMDIYLTLHTKCLARYLNSCEGSFVIMVYSLHSQPGVDPGGAQGACAPPPKLLRLNK